MVTKPPFGRYRFPQLAIMIRAATIVCCKRGEGRMTSFRLRASAAIVAAFLLAFASVEVAAQADLQAIDRRMSQHAAKGNYAAALVEAKKLEAAIKARFGTDPRTMPGPEQPRLPARDAGPLRRSRAALQTRPGAGAKRNTARRRAGGAHCSTSWRNMYVDQSRLARGRTADAARACDRRQGAAEQRSLHRQDPQRSRRARRAAGKVRRGGARCTIARSRSWKS